MFGNSSPTGCHPLPTSPIDRSNAPKLLPPTVSRNDTVSVSVPPPNRNPATSTPGPPDRGFTTSN